jgi:pseudouridine 5'-phosphatase
MATSSSYENAMLKMQNHAKFFELFSHKVFGTSDPEVKQGKPMPDIFLICASRFKDLPTPENVIETYYLKLQSVIRTFFQCLVFEDAPNGVIAGIRADMQVVMVPDPQLDESFTKEATLVLSSLEEFKPELFGLPAFEN